MKVGTICERHGKSRTKLYYVWKSMKTRCNSTRYKHYGGRGISVSKEWDRFTEFEKWAIASGYKLGLEIDRINNNGNYEPDNCRFVTHAENNRNRGNHKLTVDAIPDIRRRLALKETHKSIANLYKVDQSTITDINVGKLWVGVGL